ncbi:hypothetical protein DCMF_03610 [Candidatus Formimonas warabiya]|uniref:SHS2 domain-containing protein n=2 Tax=Formimonas warabiya TaxID=1761012 RepID=A0A3G1KNF9_FORW1|nr:hypothetical protein DCMF_03610 [Candidatus Formimonas warabiya]
MGIDIGSRDIKLVEMAGGPLPQIAAMGRIATPPGALDDGAILQVEPVVNAIRTVMEQAGNKSRKAVTIISGRNVITRFIKLPKMSPKEVASTLKWEADKYIPLSAGTDMIVDHLILGNVEEEINPQINVLLVGVPRKLVYQVYETFSKAGLELLAVEIEPLSLWRSIGTTTATRTGSQAIREEGFISLDIGAKASNLAIFQGDELIFSRYLPMAGDGITNAVSLATSLEFNAAQVIKERDGELLLGQTVEQAPPDKVILDKALKESLLPLAGEIRRSIDFYRSQYKRDEPKVLIISGGTAKMKGLPAFLQAELGIPVSLGLQHIAIKEHLTDKKSKEVKNMDPAFAVAVGLALREVE